MAEKKKYKGGKLTPELRDGIAARAVMQVLDDRVGGKQNLLIQRDDEGKIFDSRMFDRKAPTPCGRGRWRGGKALPRELVEYALHEIGFPMMHALSPNEPTMSSQSSLRKAALDMLVTMCSCTEQDFDAFDSFNPAPEPGEPVAYSRWSNFGGAAIYLEDGRRHFETGLEIAPENKVWADVIGRIAEDEEFKEKLPGLLELLDVYHPGFRSPHGSLLLQSMGLQDITATPPDSWLGNYQTDLTFQTLADAWADVDVRRVLSLLGPGNNGKSFMLQLTAKALGSEVMDIGLESAALTLGTETCFGQRLLDARRRMAWKRIVAGQESIRNGVVDSRFVKGATSADEEVEIGGMYQSSRPVNLKGQYIIASNFVLRTNDPTKGTDRRLHYQRYAEDFAGRTITRAEMFATFDPFLPTFRRLVMESVRFRVEAQNSRNRDLHPLLDADTEAFRRASEWSFYTNLKSSLRKV